MRRATLAVIRILSLTIILLALPGLTSTALAANGNNSRQYDRGCADAKVGSYDRAQRNPEYERGWQACNKPAKAEAGGGKDYDRGCADAKVGSYDRAQRNPDYERGWQACNKPQ